MGAILAAKLGWKGRFLSWVFAARGWQKKGRGPMSMFLGVFERKKIAFFGNKCSEMEATPRILTWAKTVNLGRFWDEAAKFY